MTKRILVVSEDVGTIEVVQETLQTAGYEVSVVSDGTEALMVIEQLLDRVKSDEDPNLIVLDNEVKRPGGETIYEHLHRGHKLLFITGVKDDRRGIPVYELPFIVLWNKPFQESPPFSVSKPIDPRRLVDFIQHHLSLQDRHAAQGTSS